MLAYMMHDWAWGGGWIGMWLLMVGFWVLAIVAVVWGIRAWTRPTPRPMDPTYPASSPTGYQSALDILAERFARGEISKDEFEERRRVLLSR
jgi:putative membrane protein